MISIPMLETPRLLLRQFRPSDFDALARLSADPEVMKYLGDGRPKSRAEAWLMMASYLGHWELRGYGLWAVEDKATGEFVGRIGLLNPEGWPGLEVAWTLARERWGKGFATEGAKAALEYSFSVLKLDHVISLIHPDNAPSIRVALRVGEKLEGQVELFGVMRSVYGIRRSGIQRSAIDRP
jgi:RimJ/RimL family protein N-acetyltransferase